MKAESETPHSKAEDTPLAQADAVPSALNLQLKIGFDGKRAANNLTGLGNYSRSLIAQLAKQFPQHQYLVYTPKVKNQPQINLFFAKENIHLKTPKNGQFLWRSFKILKDLARDGVNIFHGLSNEIPLAIQHTKIKSIVTIHDLIFLRYPQYYKALDRKLYTWKSKSACKRANRIIAISEKTKSDLMEFYHIPEEKIEVIYQTCDDRFKIRLSPEILQNIKNKYQLPDNYILNVGTIEERKNLKLLVQALPLINEHCQLVVIGKETAYFKQVNNEIQKLGLKNRIKFLKNIPFEDLPGIYQLAKVFAYPSFYEGFGIPIIEALYASVPVVAATGSCLEEAGGPNSLYVSPHQADELATAINQILSSKEKQKEMKEKGLQFVQKFNSPLVAQQLMDCYKKLIS